MLNAKILELAKSLAQKEGSELHVAHAWRLFGEKTLLSVGRMSESDVRELVRKAKKEHQERVIALVERYAPGTPRDRIYVVKGDAESVLPALAVLKRSNCWS
ncbi:MAG TPA: hypothetical protein VLG39_06610 [Nitrospirota bacterium]|nr:hypothetical protein [Nitrospirota bacterium]